MSTRFLLGTAFLYFVAATAAVLQAQAPERTVWQGAYTAEQAARGEGQFAQHCMVCHGAQMEGGEGPALVGDRFWNDWRETTLDSLLGFVRKNKIGRAHV